MSTQLADIYILKYWTSNGPKVEAIGADTHPDRVKQLCRARANRWNTVCEVHTIQESKIIHAHDALDHSQTTKAAETFLDDFSGDGREIF